MNQRHPNCRCIMITPPTKKVWDVRPPLGWNWTSDDWRMYNFFRDLDSHGGVLSGGLCDRYVLLQYNKAHPAESLIIFEDHSEVFGHMGPENNVRYLKNGGTEMTITMRRS